MTADQLVAALKVKHADDVFVPECKDGATQTRAHRRLDAWVLLKTWSPITTIGYEVKVARSDWMRDEKLATYQGLCHQLYVVAPKGIIGKDEVPEGVGLIEAVGASDRLITRKRASRREIDIPVTLLIYVLMCRAKIDPKPEERQSELDPKAWRVRQLREWVEGKEERRALSFAVSERIRRAFNEQDQRQCAIEQRLSDLDTVRKRIVELGFDPERHVNTWAVNDRLARLAGSVPSSLPYELDALVRSLTQVKASLAQLKAGAASASEEEA